MYGVTMSQNIMSLDELGTPKKEVGRFRISKSCFYSLTDKKFIRLSSIFSLEKSGAYSVIISFEEIRMDN